MTEPYTQLTSHLSEEAIESLYTEYMNGVKNVDLVEKYGIQIKDPRLLIKAIPPQKQGDCPFCGSSTYQERVRKNQKYIPPAVCPSCNHHLSGDCQCEHCIKQQAQQMLEIETVRYETLSIGQCLILFILMQSKSKYGDILNPQYTASPYLTPDKQYTLQVIREMADTRIIIPSPSLLNEDMRGMIQKISPGLPKTRLTTGENALLFIPNVSRDGSHRMEMEKLQRLLWVDLQLLAESPDREKLEEYAVQVLVTSTTSFACNQIYDGRLEKYQQKRLRKLVESLLLKYTISQTAGIINSHAKYAKAQYQKNRLNDLNHSINIFIKRVGYAVEEPMAMKNYPRHPNNPESILEHILLNELLGFPADYYTKNIYESLHTTGNDETEFYM